jgi:hypothetical protein
VTGGWRKLQNEELHNFYSSPNIIRMFKSRRMKLVEHKAHMGEVRNYTKFLLEHLKGRVHLEDLGIDGRTLLKWILRK